MVEPRRGRTKINPELVRACMLLFTIEDTFFHIMTHRTCMVKSFFYSCNKDLDFQVFTSLF